MEHHWREILKQQGPPRLVGQRRVQRGIMLPYCYRLLLSGPLQSHAGLLRPIHPVKQKNQVPKAFGAPVASLVTISTTAGLAFATISGIESAFEDVFKNTSNTRIKPRLKYLLICDKNPVPCFDLSTTNW